MASEILDTTNVTKPVNVVHQMNFLDRAKQLCPYFAGHQQASIMEHAGTFTAQWRRIENLTPSTTALSELTGNLSFPTRDSVVPTMTDVTATVLKYGQHFYPNEEMQLANFSNTTEELLRVLAHSAGRSLNMLQRNEMEDNSTQVRVGGQASDALIASAITLTTLATVVNTLDRNDAMPFTGLTDGSVDIGTQPVLESFYAITHPDVAYDIGNLNGFTSVEKYAGQVQVLPGEFGYLGQGLGVGIRFVRSSDSTIDSGAGAALATSGLRGNTNIDLYNTVIYGQSAFGAVGFGRTHIRSMYRAGDNLPAVMIINKPRGSAGAADPYDEIATLGYKSWHVAKILNSAWSRNIRSGATLLSG